MYRSTVLAAAAKRLLHAQLRRSNAVASPRISHLSAVINNTGRFTTSASPQSFANHQIPNAQQPPPPPPSSQLPHYTDPSSSSPSTSSTAHEAPPHDHQSAGGVGGRRPPRLDYQDEQARVLQASLRHVNRLGWSEAAMIAGAREVGLSPSIVGSFPRKQAALVEYFMDDCLQRLIDIIDSGEALKNIIPSERISKLVRIRLEMQAPYISKWPQALSIQAQPLNIPTSFKQRAMLVDEIWHAVGDEASDLDWYVKRTILGGIYSTTEVFMLTDSSPEFRDTWAFLDDRVKDAFDLKKTIQEAKYLAEAVSAGMGSSLEGFMRRAFK